MHHGPGGVRPAEGWEGCGSWEGRPFGKHSNLAGVAKEVSWTWRGHFGKRTYGFLWVQGAVEDPGVGPVGAHGCEGPGSWAFWPWFGDMQPLQASAPGGGIWPVPAPAATKDTWGVMPFPCRPEACSVKKAVRGWWESSRGLRLGGCGEMWPWPCTAPPVCGLSRHPSCCPLPSLPPGFCGQQSPFVTFPCPQTSAPAAGHSPPFVQLSCGSTPRPPSPIPTAA